VFDTISQDEKRLAVFNSSKSAKEYDMLAQKEKHLNNEVKALRSKMA